MSNIIVLSGSPRKGGNTDLLVDAFVKGAEKNNNVEVVSVADYKVNPCMVVILALTGKGMIVFSRTTCRWFMIS